MPEGEYLVPIGVAEVKREGTRRDASSPGRRWSRVALKAAEQLADEGMSCEVVDPRTLRPLDKEPILASVRKTNRCVVVEEGWAFAGVGAQMAYIIQREAFDELDAPVMRVTGADVPMPYAKNLEQLAMPSAARVVEAVQGSAVPGE